MKKFVTLSFIALVLLGFNSCSAIAAVFQTGAVVGIIAAIVLIALIIWVVSLFRGKS